MQTLPPLNPAAGRPDRRVDSTAADSDTSPAWAALVRSSSCWEFAGNKLIHRDAQEETDLAVRPAYRNTWFHRAVVSRFWAAQKNSSVTKSAVSRLLADLGPDEWGLNLGSGETSFHPQVLNLDIYASENIDIVNRGHAIPLQDNSVSLVLSQEVLEHVEAPHLHIQEAWRVLRPGGLFYCQLPFMIGYHPGPNDYWRFTRESYGQLFPQPGWEIVELERSLGHGSGFYRVLVEFVAVNFSLLSPRLYKPSKGIGALLFYPLQWLDCLTSYSEQADRIPGGYYCVAKKVG